MILVCKSSGMNRMELIAKLARKRGSCAPMKAQGLAVAAGAKPVTRPLGKVPPITGGEARYACQGLNLWWHTGRASPVEPVAKAKQWRPKFRKGKHWLTRVAEGWRK